MQKRSIRLVFAFLFLLTFSYFAIAQTDSNATTNTSSGGAGCNMPACVGAYQTGEYYDDGCPKFVCLTSNTSNGGNTTACPAPPSCPVLMPPIDGKCTVTPAPKDANGCVIGCAIYTCSTSNTTGGSVVAYLNQKFELKEGQFAVVQDYKDLKIKYVDTSFCGTNALGGVEQSCPIKIMLQVSMPSGGNTEKGTDFSLSVGEKKEIFGVTLSFVDFNNGIAVLVVTNDKCPMGCICTEQTTSCPTCQEGYNWNPKTEKCEQSIISICPTNYPCANNTQSNVTIGSEYRNAYWQCQNGKEWKSEGNECLPYEQWKKKAINFCNGECKGEHCGVNSFSLGQICYATENTTSTQVDNSTTGSSNWTDVLVCKNSCPLDEKCYPFGYRKSDKFCSDSGSFEKQLSGNEKCENNFQCSSNLCIDSQCVSQGVWQRFINWFKKLFG